MSRVARTLRPLLAVTGVVLLAALWVVGAPRLILATLVVWDVLAAALLAIALVGMWRGRTEEDRSPARAGASSPVVWRRLGFVGVLLASAAGLSSGLLIVTVDSIDADLAADFGSLAPIRWCAAVTVVLAWLTLHSGYASHYRDLYGGGIRFPGTPEPNTLDFAYFAFTVGATFATSDVEITSRRIRHAVLWHSVISFFYNAAVLGIAIGAFTGK